MERELSLDVGLAGLDGLYAEIQFLGDLARAAAPRIPVVEASSKGNVLDVSATVQSESPCASLRLASFRRQNQGVGTFGRSYKEPFVASRPCTANRRPGVRAMAFSNSA